MRTKERDVLGAFRCANPRFEVKNAAEEEAEIVLYNSIGGWFGVWADEFRSELKAIKAKTIHLRINSPGGVVSEAMAIYNSLKEHDAKVITHIDGLAASAASVVALAGDEIIMGEGAMYMIHDPLLITVGNARELRKDADVLDQFGAAIAGIYQRKTGQTAEQVAAWMEDETWFTPEQAVEAGFADRVSYDTEPSATQATFDLSVFANVPDSLRQHEDEGREPTDREIEQALRDVGLSQAAAKRYVSAGRAADAQRDAECQEQRDAAPEPSGHNTARVRSMTLESIRAAAEEA